jgi:hypothetical protein
MILIMALDVKTPNRWCFDRFGSFSVTPRLQTDPIGSEKE